MSYFCKVIVVGLSVMYGLFASAQGQLSIGERDYWINRYLSVSYPLENISISSPFGQRHDPITGERASHSGIDLRASFEEVLAMFDGAVERIGSDNRSGNFVVLRHGEYTISYCHLSRVLLERGSVVHAGDVVAISGNTGRTTGPHLHITARKNGTLTDPNDLLIYIMYTREECLRALGLSALIPEDEDTFFRSYSSVAMEHQRMYGIPASVTLSQMALESGFGQSSLARNGNNFFGIRAGRSWAGGKSWHDDDVPGYFKHYATVWESIDDHSRLLMTDRYKRCRLYDAQDYHHWLVEIKRAGYASAADYVESCEGIIRRYKLYLYDREAAEL